ncbi:hypothetical protein APHAL10511_005953 [Amanita phalloides]|nr:hypothetical protein APHAL10511_005953 [Amanita phalloides]
MITAYSRGRQCYSLCRLLSAKFSSTALAAGRHPNPPLHLDPSLEALLKDVDMSLLNHKNSSTHRELQVYPGELAERTDSNIVEPVEEDVGLGRKSPAAEFGSQKIGAVILPSQLTKSICQLIQESNKALLHVDAKRLFYEDGTDGWDAQYDIRYRSRHQSARHAERDGIAFASVALPAHYSAIRAVLSHVRKRLGPSWSVNNVIDWGAGVGSGLWATVHSFQVSEFEQDPIEASDPCLSGSTISHYIGIDKRDGLVSMGKRLVDGIDCGNLRIRWQRSFRNEDLACPAHKQTIALSAFLLSTLSSPLARRTVVKEMWESGAEVMVLIDHRSAGGFGAIAEAREYLLQLGKKELEGPQADTTSSSNGSHVVAPCPHDGTCPLFHGGGSRLACGFSQRVQRPEFVRRTKHSKTGHEDIEYSYVVIRRGARPPAVTTQAGRVGEVGLRAIQQTALRDAPIKELSLHDGSEERLLAGSEEPTEPENVVIATIENQKELEVTLRQEAFGWPRLILHPLKRSGHVILDCCTVEGKIMRMTIPRSQGRQPYYDARKSSWGDIFPHQPKNPGQERHLSSKKQNSRNDTQVSKKSKSVPGYKKPPQENQKRTRRHHLEAILSEAQ